PEPRRSTNISIPLIDAIVWLAGDNGLFRFSSDVVVELRHADKHVRHQPQEANPERQNAEQYPAEKPQAETEQLPFMSAHHRLAPPDGFERADRFGVGENEKGHRI